MNERIRELRRLATLVETYTANDGSVHEGKSVDLEKFAELIVRECIDQCADIPGSNDEYDKGIRWAANQIKQHFGVEE